MNRDSERFVQEGRDEPSATGTLPVSILVAFLAGLTLLILLSLWLLVGVGLPGSGHHNEVKVLRARNEIKQLRSAIEAFWTRNGFLPPDGTGTSPGLLDGGCAVLVECLDGDGFIYNVEGLRGRGEANHTYIILGVKDLGSAAGARRTYLKDWLASEHPEFLDPWGRPYQYVRNVDQNGQQVSHPPKRSSKYPDPRYSASSGKIVPKNPQSFDLWSLGPDPNDPSDDMLL